MRESDPSPLHPDDMDILQGFAYEHLPHYLQDIAKPLCELAYDMAGRIPQSPELTAGLRNLLRAKNCLVGAAMPLQPEIEESHGR